MHRDEFEIINLQGNKLNDNQRLIKLMEDIDWAKMKMSYVIDFAKLIGLKSVSIRGIENNDYVQAFRNISDYVSGLTFEKLFDLTNKEMREVLRLLKGTKFDFSKIHLLPNRGYRIYDMTAISLGFKKDRFGDYIFDL